jgi:hypothetical protein
VIRTNHGSELFKIDRAAQLRHADQLLVYELADVKDERERADKTLCFRSKPWNPT